MVHAADVSPRQDGVGSQGERGHSGPLFWENDRFPSLSNFPTLLQDIRKKAATTTRIISGSSQDHIACLNLGVGGGGGVKLLNFEALFILVI